jgi:DNA-binding CsgD family transcriptional regulator/predicted negative regulator of RcsB-dependent stress response
MLSLDGAIVGREEELDAIERFLAGAARRPTALILEGEAGIGKSTLWAAAVRAATTCPVRVLQSRPAEPERRSSFAALGDLIGRLEAHWFHALPPPQRTALEGALLRGPAEQNVDPGVVAVGLTSLLAALARERPLVLAIDDAQWIDGPSATALAFALRRLADLPVGILVARRLGLRAPLIDALAEAVPEADQHRLTVGRLSFGALYRLLTSRAGHVFPRPTAARIERASAGNPMLALEIARAFLESGAQGRVDQALPVPEHLRHLLGARLRRLSKPTREILLLVSALSHPTMELIERASGDTAATAASLDEAETAGVLVIEDGRVRFSHPLLGSVVYGSAPSASRRAIHERLARVVEDLEELAHHLSLAHSRPDASLAQRIEEGGLQTYRRGAPDVAAELLARARVLTPAVDVEPAARRLVEEAEARLEAGDTAGARDLIETSKPWLPAGPTRARGLLLLGTAYWYLDASRAASCLEEALEDASTDPMLAGRIHSRLALFKSTGDLLSSVAHNEAAIELIDAEQDPSALAFAIFGKFYSQVLLGRGADMPLFDRALALEAGAPSWEASTIPALWWKYTDQDVKARERLELHLRWARESGDESSDADLYAHLAELEVYSGRWSDADRFADLSVDATEQMGVPAPNSSHRVRALVDAYLGRVAQASAAAGLGVESTDDDPSLCAMYLDVVGYAALCLGDHSASDRAYTRAASILEADGTREPLRFRFEPEHIETLLALGEVARAEAVLARLEERDRILRRPWSSATAARCQGLVLAAQGDRGGAQQQLELAVEAHRDLTSPFERARTLLVQGQVQRRAGHRRAAAETLRQALEIFVALPAPIWAERTRREAARLGARRGAGEGLTPTERRVAELAAEGMTNREVAQEMVVSPKTVEANLARVYSKLGIRSRAELGRVMVIAEERRR